MEYRILKYNSVAVLMAFFLSSLNAGCGDEDPACPADIDAPQVISTYPAEGDTLVPSDTTITVTFSEIMSPATVSAGTFVLTGPEGTAPAKVTYLGSVVEIDPYFTMAGHSLYTVSIDPGVSDFAGNRMKVPYAWSFNTGKTDLLLYPDIEYTLRDGDLDGEADEMVGGGPPGRILMSGNDGEEEDRAVMEFPLAEIMQDSVIQALGFLTFSESSLPSYPGNIEIWGFSADGEGNISDYDAGALLYTYEDSDMPAGNTFVIPVIDAINAALSYGATHLGIRIVVTGGAKVGITTSTDLMSSSGPRVILIY